MRAPATASSRPEATSAAYVARGLSRRVAHDASPRPWGTRTRPEEALTSSGWGSSSEYGHPDTTPPLTTTTTPALATARRRDQLRAVAPAVPATRPGTRPESANHVTPSASSTPAPANRISWP